MSVKKNVGTVDALIRIFVGTAGLIWCATRTGRRFPWLLAVFFGMKVVEGITRYCPILDLLGIKTQKTRIWVVKSPEHWLSRERSTMEKSKSNYLKHPSE
ncbi:YgaP family membrane protein [Staphylospora marina]|uniref:YgaP family membrane protein n=1 Tax=Staphylospora marina TaxID=2490858 RepID=UPI000F5B9C40|nr:DUF2892 domain-containing protein [Staphylospora marina]